MKRLLLVIAIIALYLLHQDFWFWRAAAPVVFGFLPVGLFYHLCYTLVISALMWALVQYAWPSHLEEGRGDGATGGQGEEDLFAPSPRRPVAPSLDTEEARRS
jgi:hypothetical protein